MTNFTRRSALMLGGGAAMGLFVGPRGLRAQDNSLFRFVPHAALRVLDPVSTPAYITRDHGHMVYDQLFSLDATYQPTPQMVETWEESPDHLSWTFTLREGLAWHDGPPVTAEDCIASIARWGKRDIVGLRLSRAISAMTALDARTFRIELTEPFGIMLEALAKVSSIPLFMMPKRFGETPPEQALTEVVGSGPFKWVPEAFDPGAKWAYLRNDAYIPRDEPPSGMGGGKVPMVERFEVTTFPSMQTALAALQNGEVDAVESFGVDSLPLVSGNPDITTAKLVMPTAPTIRMNWAQPPFSDVRARRAVQAAVTQADYLAAAVGDPEHYMTCPAIFGCGTALETDAGVVDKGQPDMEKAKALLAESGYDGATVVLINPTDLASFQPLAALTTQVLTDLGMTVDVQGMDWNSFLSRRTITAPPSEGGWNIAHAVFGQLDFNSPLTNPNFDARGLKGYTGFVDDPKTEELKTAFQRAGSLEERQAIAKEMQIRAYDQVFYIPLGNYFAYTAQRANVTRVRSPLPVGWGAHF
ncbi:MAG: ABC transporter substrate-binding protein [Rhodobacteraceae bacterium]|nr:ABC transporter substrate-binding protein [Paracoccaceae bacterium]